MDKGKVIECGTKDELIEIIKENKRIKLRFDKVSDELMKKIKDVSYIDKIKIIENEIAITTNNGDSIFKDIIDIASMTNSNILSIDVKKPNLEEVFLHLTGRALRD